jgi:hypothetical protein
MSSFILAFLTKFYYGGDTVMYFTGALQIAYSDISAFIDFMTHLNYESWDISTINFLHDAPANYFKSPSNSIVGKMAAVPALFLFGSYTAVCGFFSLLGFIGTWKIYKVFVHEYPSLHKQLFYSILFFPSVVYWTSGVLKEPLTILGLGFVTEFVFRWFIKGQRKPILLVTTFLTAYLMYLVKGYVLFAFIPAASLWVFKGYHKTIRNGALQFISMPIFIIFSVIGSFTLLSFFGNDGSTRNSRYSIENFLTSSDQTRNAFSANDSQTEAQKRFGSTGASYVDIGSTDGTFLGNLRMFPIAVITTLFRPYLWEVRNPFMLLAAIENLILLGFSLNLLWKVGIRRLGKFIYNTPILLMCVLFSIVFSGMVGISTPNFGSISRYRIPCLPFYGTALVILHYSILKVRQQGLRHQ